MNDQQVAQLLVVAKAAFPSMQIQPETGALWCHQLAEVPADCAMTALQEHIGMEHFPPVIADVKRRGLELADEIRQRDEARADHARKEIEYEERRLLEADPEWQVEQLERSQRIEQMIRETVKRMNEERESAPPSQPRWRWRPERLNNSKAALVFSDEEKELINQRIAAARTQILMTPGGHQMLQEHRKGAEF